MKVMPRIAGRLRLIGLLWTPPPAIAFPSFLHCKNRSEFSSQGRKAGPMVKSDSLSRWPH
jgi:hypothetical protein